jgi:hypothetical protein
MAVGAPPVNVGVGAGLVRIFARQDTRDPWVQRGDDIVGEATGDEFGVSVSLAADGQTVAIGANENDGANGINSGHVRIFDWSDTAWVQRGGDIDGEAADDESGISVSLAADGETVAIGAKENDGVGVDKNNTGHVRVFDWSGGEWTRFGDDIDGEAADDNSGISVSLAADGKTVAIGANFNDGNNLRDSGHVRMFYRSGTAWDPLGGDIDGEGEFDFSGTSVSLAADGKTVAIGAFLNGGNGDSSGHVRIYDLFDGDWTQRGDDIDGEAAGDFSGYSVSLAADGETVAIGAPQNGEFLGHVRIFDWSGTAWVQRGGDIDGEAVRSFIGLPVSLAADGETVAIVGSGIANGGGILTYPTGCF